MRLGQFAVTSAFYPSAVGPRGMGRPMHNFRFSRRSTAGLRRRPALADLLRLVANMKLLLVISIGSKEVWLLSVPDEHQMEFFAQ